MIAQLALGVRRVYGEGAVSVLAPSEVVGIPHPASDLFEQLLAEPLQPTTDLRSQVQTYWDRIRAESAAGAPIDELLGSEIAVASLDLLGSVGPDTSAATRQLIQAAVRYFIIEEDAIADLTSMAGFEDDAQVFNAVVHHLGRNDLLVQAA